MGLFNKLFGKDKAVPKKKETSTALLKIKEIQRLTSDAVKVIFDIPTTLNDSFQFIPGQYLTLILKINGKEEHRSYSICSGINEDLAIGIKQIPNGIVSTYFNTQAKAGDEIEVVFPTGRFTLTNSEGNYIAIAGGSGITPILSIAKSIHNSLSGKLHILYGNRDETSIMFAEEINQLDTSKVSVTHIFSEQEKDGILFGMLTEENITSFFRNNLALLKADGFYICGPEQVILNTQNALKTFGVSEDKLHYELFTTPVNLKSTTATTPSDFQGIAQVTIILDEEEETFELASDGSSILSEAESYGMDAPYSCRGGVCSTCKAKVLEGSASMDKNFTLTDKEVAEGYILTCQAHPSSPKIIVSYDE
ncbi:MAG: 2Fe-2S iron-sulfur cluster binding domain-containing protein [Brumimicrobium sp.]|nr:2Fe-2S iron-sulfur cluster binding domain-containing protein [Brumimicrobium sp.]